jgi:serine/threonine protein kinase/tetratricopeptide (TPR) repeat protein
VEVCPGCRFDLRPLARTGFFAAIGGRTASPLAQPDMTVLADASLLAADGATVLSGLTTPGLQLDPEVTRLGIGGATAVALTPPPVTRGTIPSRPRTGGAAAAREGPLEIGEVLGGRYHIIRLLGIGGMGAVYQAWDSELELALAFKVIRSDGTDPAGAAAVEARFKRELLLARQVTHPNVVRIHDLGEIDGLKYITMPYIEGQDLSAILTEFGTLPVPRVLKIAKQVASGLCAAHEAGVVHRDLKPANIMIDAEDGALIMDFGIARATGDAVDSRGAGLPQRRVDAGETRVGTVVGTIEYMSPEQARAQPVDHRSDIYAFGMILYRMTVGRRLAEGATDSYTDLMARMKSEPARLREVDPALPEGLEKIVSTCLQPDPAARYATTADLVEALERLDENGIPLPEPAPLWRSWRFWTTAVALVGVLVGGTWWTAQQLAPAVPVTKSPVSVLIADFTNQTGDPLFNGLLEQSLGVAVEGASFVTAYDRRNALRVASQLNAGKALDEKVARLVAQREGVKVVLAGAIVPDGAGYRLAVKGINPADGAATVSADVRARNRDDVLAAVGRLGSEIRKSLGDTTTKRTPAANEMLSASSFEAVAEYIKGQELTRQTRDEEAIPYFKRATELDPNFGRAFSAWGTAAFKIGRQAEAEAQYKKALSLLDRMTERERYRTLGVYYLAGSKNYDKAIENFSTLVKLYPSDAAAYNNLAVAYTNKLDFPKASENGRKALEIYPKNRLYRSNYALYAMYAGDFKTSSAEADNLLKDDPKYFIAYLPLAMAALARNDSAAARGYYEQMQQVNARAASLASIGLADLAVAEGRTSDAIVLLKAGIASDEAAKIDAGAATKRMALAEAYELDGDLTNAVDVAAAAVAALQTEAILVPAGRLFAEVRQQRQVDKIAGTLANQFEPQKRAYGRIIDALDYISRERYVDAVDSLKESVRFADLWLARFYLGVAYETAGRHGEAISELTICEKRRGEATALFIDEVPTYRYLAPLPYWLARAQEGLGQIGQARAKYQEFLAQRSGPTKDPLVADARRRLAGLASQ